MDFIRATLKALFYDMPLATVADMLLHNVESPDCLTKILPNVLKWQEPNFTVSEIAILTDMCRENWFQRNEKETGCNSFASASELQRIFMPVNHFCKAVLNDDQDFPRVRFEHLLRWHDITHYIGEEILSLSFLADRDLKLLRERNRFTWPDVLEHDATHINRLFNEGLADVHAHLFATADIFTSNWLSLMCSVAFGSCKDDYDEKVAMQGILAPYQEFDIQVLDFSTDLSIHHWGIVASQIRAVFTAMLFDGESFDCGILRNMITSRLSCIAHINDTKSLIGTLCCRALRLPNGKVVDYAIRKDNVLLQSPDINEPYMIHYGERMLLYKFFYEYYSGNTQVIAVAPWMYLYLLVKVKYRREFVKTNPLLGLDNFISYNRRSGMFLCSSKHHIDIAYRYAVQTAIGADGKNMLEARLQQHNIKNVTTKKLSNSIFTDTSYLMCNLTNNLTLVVHFIKQLSEKEITNGVVRHAELRKRLKKEIRDVIHEMKQLSNCSDSPQLTGIDVAGPELKCRPEVFAPYYRLARQEGLFNHTYHAGEDFYDLVDGIRAIDETVLFFRMGYGCRIGHALALGVDALEYYHSRHRNVIIPRQLLLDNLIWLYYRSRDFNITLEPSTLKFIDDTVHSLLSQIGYGYNIDTYDYWQSMLLRGDAIDMSTCHRVVFGPAADCDAQECREARFNEKAKEIHDLYETNREVRINGDKPYAYLLPQNFYCDVTKMQAAMLELLENNGIAIECCPSSNLNIGPFDRYDKLPILKFLSVQQPRKYSLSVSICTDDRGIFATSLHREYSLIAIALTKQRDNEGHRVYNNDTIEEYLKHIIGCAKKQRF